jgi:hypothetical protein
LHPIINRTRVLILLIGRQDVQTGVEHCPPSMRIITVLFRQMEKYVIVPAFASSISYLFCAIVCLHLLQNLAPVTAALGQFLS